MTAGPKSANGERTGSRLGAGHGWGWPANAADPDQAKNNEGLVDAEGVRIVHTDVDVAASLKLGPSDGRAIR